MKAPETPMGHGDAFFSIAMALQAAYESSLYNVQSLGNVMDWFEDFDPDSTQQKSSNSSTDLQKKWGKVLTPGSALDDNDPDSWDGTSLEEPTPEDLVAKALRIQADAPNPQCSDSLCNPTYWVKERNLCLYCGHRG